MKLLEPITIDILGEDNVERQFVISKIPSMDWLKIFSVLVSLKFNADKYKENESLVIDVLKYSGVPRESGEPLMLTTKALIDSHTAYGSTLFELLIAMITHNYHAFLVGRISGLKEESQSILPQITKMLTVLLPRLSTREKLQLTS